MMERELRSLLAETALMATGIHRHEEAETIASCLESQEGTKEVVAMIRSMSLMNQGRYEFGLLSPECCGDHCKQSVRSHRYTERPQSRRR